MHALCLENSERNNFKLVSNSVHLYTRTITTFFHELTVEMNR